MLFTISDGEDMESVLSNYVREKEKAKDEYGSRLKGIRYEIEDDYGHMQGYVYADVWETDEEFQLRWDNREVLRASKKRKDIELAKKLLEEEGILPPKGKG